MDLVLEHGWAYGSKGRALVGKTLMTALTTGGGEAAYHHEGRNRHTLRELLAPVEQTARLCGMRWLPPFVVYGTHRLTPAEVERAADEYARVLEALRDGALDLDAIAGAPRLRPEDLPAREGR
jgi:glutathione-regulated potassium-efflux system ancillary protein KefG